MRNFRFSTRRSSAAFAPRQAVLYRSARAAAALLAAIACIAVAPAGAQLEEVLQAQAATDAAAAKSQEQINDLVDRTEETAARYAQVLAEAKSFERYNEKLSEQLKAQQQEIASIKRQLQEIENTAREIKPLMENMVQSLARFVALDLPFLPKERAERVQDLEHLLTRVDVSISEQYRQIVEAYLIELEYGHTLGAYTGRLGSGEGSRAVQFVRLGRVTLMYQTLDGKETGYWDAKQNKWVVANDYAEAFETALKMANKTGAPELLTVPVPVPQEAPS
ncbi:MAG: DUF3450 domain-containing protein [Nitrococcus sp.]|nr:DUF3450 domain-containing protein [Nitrococcus sp.]